MPFFSITHDTAFTIFLRKFSFIEQGLSNKDKCLSKLKQMYFVGGEIKDFPPLILLKIYQVQTLPKFYFLLYPKVFRNFQFLF